MDLQATGNKRIEWPIYVLKGNGSVDVLSAGIDTARYKLWPLLAHKWMAVVCSSFRTPPE